MAGGTEFKRGKLKELVLYLAQASADDSGFGMVKLNKLLFRADFEAYRLLGRSITGEEYEKQDYGPVARHLPIVLDDLAAAGYIIWHRVAAGAYTRKVPEAVEPPDMVDFTDDEQAIIDRTLTELVPFGGKTVSEWSHLESAGWRVAEVGQEIPYETAIVSSKEPPPHAVEQLRQRVLSGNWD